MKIIKYSLIIASVYLLTGCVVTDPCVNNPNCMTNAEKDAYFEKMRQKEKDESKSMSMSLEQYREYKNQKAKAEEQEKLEHYASYEKNYLSEYNNILKNTPELKTTYIQPANKKEPCKIMFSHTENDQWFKEETYKVFWDGECKNGYADGLGREIEKDTLMDKWGLAIYKNGIPTYYIINYVLENKVFEGVDDQNERIGIHTSITDKMSDIDVTIEGQVYNHKNYTALVIYTSPFWNGTYQYIKGYPNFNYRYINNQNNVEAKYDFQFFLTDHKNRNGWAIEKLKNNDKLLTGEYVNNKGQLVDLPSSYNTKADEIIKEINEAQQKAYQAQEQAQLVKKQYMKKICKDTVKVDFMNNEDYKSICSNQKEKELYTKINNKLERLTKEKIAKLEQQRYNEQQKQQEQYKQQQLTLERQRLETQQKQARAAQDAADAAGWQNLNQSIQNMNYNNQMQQLNNNLFMMKMGY